MNISFLLMVLIGFPNCQVVSAPRLTTSIEACVEKGKVHFLQAPSDLDAADPAFSCEQVAVGKKVRA